MSKSAPFLGTTTNVDEAFPGITEIDLTVVQDPFSVYGAPIVHRYSKQTLPRFERCVNSRCQQGGIDLQKHVLFWGEAPADFRCDGHEGSPQGRRKGHDCMNTYQISAIITKTQP